MATNLYGNSCTPNLGGVQDFYTKAEVNQLLAVKANTSTTYTRTYIDGELASILGSIASLDADKIDQPQLDAALASLQGTIESNAASTYATLVDTYTRSEVDTLIDAIDFDPSTYLRREPLNTSINTINPGSVDAIALTVRGSSANPIVTRWLDSASNVIGYISNNGVFTLRGDLEVLGGINTVNQTDLVIEDKNVILSSNATIPSESDGSGIIVNGSDARFLYNNSSSSWQSNVSLQGIDGTSNDLSYTFASDDTTGIYLSSNGQLSVATQNLERLRVNNTSVSLVGGLDLILNRGSFSGTLTTESLTANQIYTLPNTSGSIVTTGDIGTVTSGMIANGTIVNEDISATAEVAVSKLANGTARQLLQTAADGVTVEWANNIDIPGTLDVTGVATFDTKISIGAAEPATSQEIGWNTDKGTLDVGLLDGVISPYGQDIITLCRNNTGAAIPKGTAVMFTGTIGNSGELTIAPMVSDGTYPGYVFFGVAAQNIAAGEDGYVRSFGEIKGVNTVVDEGGGVVWGEGDVLWCNPVNPGGFTKVEPFAPNLKLPVAAVVSVGNNGIIFVRTDTGRRLQDLHDVDANGATSNGDLLQYNASATRWEHRTNIDLPGTLDVTGIGRFDSDVIISGDLTVNGTITTVKFETLTVTDKNAILGNVDTPTDITADGGGITLKGTTDKTINWIDATDSWTSSEHFELVSGKSYRISGTEVLSSTTLGSGVTNSSLTSVGTLGSLVVTGSTTAGTFIPTSGVAPTNGLYLPSTNSVALSTNGTGRLFVDASGLVGIGTSAPDGRLEVATTGTNAVIQRWRSNLGTNNRTVTFNSPISDSASEPFFWSTANSFAWRVDDVERVRIDPEGNVGIGTTSPQSELVVRGSTPQITLEPTADTQSCRLQFALTNGTLQSGVYGGGVYGQNLVFVRATGETARIDDSGRLLVGTSASVQGAFSVSAREQLHGTAADFSTKAIFRWSNDVGQPTVNFNKSRGATIGTRGVVQSGDSLGYLSFEGDDGTNFIRAAGIFAQVDGTPGTNDMPGRLVFSTTPEGSASPVERMRISQNGVITIKNGAVAEIDTLTDAATITPNFSEGCNFTVTLGGNRTIANPINLTAGQSGSIFLVQDATGSRVVSWGSYWDFQNGTAPLLSTAPNAVDRVDYIVRNSTSIHVVFTGSYS